MDSTFLAISKYVDEHEEEMAKILENLVNLEGHYSQKENVEEAMNYMCGLLADEGFKIVKHEINPPVRCGIVTAVFGGEHQGKPVLFSGHLDTVHYPGDFGSPACKIENGKIYGPGVIDCKGGVVMALFIAKALKNIGYNERPIKIILVGDEEADHIGTNADEIIIEESRGSLCAFNMETGVLDNKVCMSRKSQITYFVTVTGVGGHAGNDIKTGRSAVLEASHKIVDMALLQDLEKGTQVTPSICHGGHQSSAFPVTCEFAVDIRIDNDEEYNRIKNGMEEIINHSYLGGTRSTYNVDVAKFKLFRETKCSDNLFHMFNDVASELGMSKFEKMHRGGVSDAGNIAYSGVPTLDSVGIAGFGAHNVTEYGVLKTMYERVKLLACLTTRLSDLII